MLSSLSGEQVLALSLSSKCALFFDLHSRSVLLVGVLVKSEVGVIQLIRRASVCSFMIFLVLFFDLHYLSSLVKLCLWNSIRVGSRCYPAYPESKCVRFHHFSPRANTWNPSLCFHYQLHSKNKLQLKSILYLLPTFSPSLIQVGGNKSTSGKLKYVYLSIYQFEGTTQSATQIRHDSKSTCSNKMNY